MDHYNWRDYSDKGEGRFPDWVSGAAAWREFVTGDFQESFRLDLPPPSRLRVFISHKRQDGALALRAEQIARNSGFSTWLDVLDPHLKALGSPRGPDRARVIAGTIEVALMNCTHVLAVVTSNTKTSRWVPYEYGRVKRFSNCACLLRGTKDIPEYLYLGAICENYGELSQWFAGQVKTAVS